MSPVVLASVALGSACVLAGRAAATADLDTIRRRLGPAPALTDPAPRTLPDATKLVRLAPIAGATVGWLAAALPGAVVGLAAGIAGPRVWSRRRAAARAALLEDQLAEAVLALSAGVRAGLSLARSVRFAAEEGEEPLAGSLRALADRTDLGVPLERSLEEWARRTGGELSAVLDQVAATLRERRAAAREVRALTAQARLSGAILGLLPIGFFLFLSVTSRQDIDAAFHTPAGIAAVALGLTMQGLAFLWIRALLRVVA